MGLVLSLGLLVQILLKLTFNFKAKSRIPFDSWDVLAGLCMVMSLLCYFQTSKMTVDDVLDLDKMRQLQYYVVITIVL